MNRIEIDRMGNEKNVIPILELKLAPPTHYADACTFANKKYENFKVFSSKAMRHARLSEPRLLFVSHGRLPSEHGVLGSNPA